MKSITNSIERHGEHHSSAATNCSSDKSIQRNWTEEEEHVFFHPIVSTSGYRDETTELEAISKSSSEESTLLSDLYDTISEVLVVSPALFWIHLICLHSSKYDLKWI